VRIKVILQAPSATGRPDATAVMAWLAGRLGAIAHYEERGAGVA
jgi:hypothetical protein